MAFEVSDDGAEVEPAAAVLLLPELPEDELAGVVEPPAAGVKGVGAALVPGAT